MSSRVAIVGAGPGGVCAAMLLAARGFEVELFERRACVGGRSGSLKLAEYTFDVGSTMLMMPFVLDEMFELAGTKTADQVTLLPVEPMYRLDFGQRALDVYADRSKMERELARFAPGSERGLARFLEQEHARLQHLYPVLQKPWPGLLSLVSARVLAALPHIGLGQSLYDTAAEYFEDEALRLGFSFQAAYLGMSPWECPGGFGMVPYVEHEWGLQHAQGGIHRICEAMARVARGHGARISLSTSVRRLAVDGDRCVGVELENGDFRATDEVIIDADATRAVLTLLDDDVSLRFGRARVEHQRESCSTFMLYLGLDTCLPLAHHTFYFAEDYRSEMERVFHGAQLANDFSLYVCNPSVTDRSMAPEGHSGLYVLALVPNTRAAIDWEAEGAGLRDRIVETLERRAGVSIRPHLRVESVLTPQDWSDSFNVSHGAVFGPTHSLDQLLAFRLPNRLPHPHNVFLSGGGTSPGSGFPTILESARLAARAICEDHSVPFPSSRGLPR